MAITSAISDLFKSIYELCASVFGAAYSVVHSVLMAIWGFFSGILTLFGDVFQGLIDIAGGVSKFVLGNIVVVSIGALAAFAFIRYTSQGRQLATGKKTA